MDRAWYSVFECLYSYIGIATLSETTLNIADDIFEQCASELHNYYVYEMRLPNYAPRLAKLTKIVSAAEVSCDKVV